MKQKLLIISLLIWTLHIFGDIEIEYEAPSYTIVTIQHAQPIKKNTKKWDLIKTISAATAIGSGVGLLGYAITDFFFPFNWYLTYKLRSIIVDAVVQNALDNNETVNYDLLSNTAWLTDWIVYLTAYGIHNRTTLSVTIHNYYHYAHTQPIR